MGNGQAGRPHRAGGLLLIRGTEAWPDRYHAGRSSSPQRRYPGEGGNGHRRYGDCGDDQRHQAERKIRRSRLAGERGGSAANEHTDKWRSRASALLQLAVQLMIVPTLRVGTHPLTLCNGKTTRSVASGVTTRSVGTITRVTQSTGTIIGGTESVAMINVIKPDAKPVGAGLLANAVGQLPMSTQTNGFRGQARSYSLRCSS
jgi:hypothetical protein